MRSVVIDHPADAVLHRHSRKIKKQPHGLLEEPQIGQQLLGMCLIETLNRLDLNYETVINQKINLERRVVNFAVEDGFDLKLPINFQTPTTQTSGQYGFVNGFEKAGAKLPVNSDRLFQDD